MVLNVFTGTAFAEIHMRQDGSLTSYYVHGAQERSFYPRSQTNYLYENETDFKKELKGGDELYGDIYVRSTDDRLIDKQSVSLEKFYIGMKNKSRDVLLGDFYSSFSEFSLSNALKGGKLELIGEHGFRYIVVGGIDTARWEDIYGEKRCEDSQTRRYVWGNRLETAYFDDALRINYNYGGAWDDWAYFSQSQSPMHVEVGSIDWLLEVSKSLTLRGEMAGSFSKTNQRSSDVEGKFDNAFKAAFDFRTEPYEMTGEYRRVGTHFNTTGGFSAQDLESLFFDGVVYIPHNVRLVHYLHMDQDNLNKSKATTTKQINPGAKLSYKWPWDINTDLGWDMRRRFTTDTTVGDLTNVYSAGFSKDFQVCYFTAQYSRTIVENYKDAQQDRARDSVILGLDGDYKVKNVKFFWNLGEDIQLEQYSKIGECKQDLLLTHSGGLKIVFPSTLTFNSKISFNENSYYIDQTNSTVNKYHFSISRDLIKDLVLSFNYDQNDRFYKQPDSDYFEIVMTGRVNYRF